MEDVEGILIRHDHGMLNGGAQFSNISRPGIGQEFGHGGVAQGLHWAPILQRKFFQEGTGEEDDILPAVPERRHSDGKDVEPEIEIFPEITRFHEVGEVFVGSGDDADVDLHGLVGADPLNGAFRESSEQLYLGRLVDFPDFIKEKSAAMGLFESADPALGGTGEGTLFVAEELGF